MKGRTWRERGGGKEVIAPEPTLALNHGDSAGHVFTLS